MIARLHALLGFFSMLPLTAAELTVARPFAPHMVLPMRREIPLSGTATPGAAVEVAFGPHRVKRVAGPDGSWEIPLPALEPSARPATLTIRSRGEEVRLPDVLVGRVFLCSGQSNMDFPLARATGGAAEAARAGAFPAIRLCHLIGAPTDDRPYDEATLARLKGSEHFTGRWQRSDGSSLKYFSAVAWWAGKQVHERDGVPVGLIENAVGGSGTEAWLPRGTIARHTYAEIAGDRWLDSPRIGAWARGRARRNLAADLSAPHPYQPAFLFETGVRMWAGFPLDAVLWYQGETNAEVADMAWNRQLLEDMIDGWRKELRQPDLPFHLVQLPRIGGNDPSRRHWPAYRDMQAAVAGSQPGVHLVVTQDLGWDSPDVHPPDKLPVARRLAESILPPTGRASQPETKTPSSR